MRFPFCSIVLCLAGAGALASCRAPEVQTTEAQAVLAFNDRVVEYLALKGKLDASAPERPEKASPQEVDANQRALASLIKSARSDAKPGAFFTPEMQSLIKTVMANVLAGPGGDTVRASIMDENPGVPEILVNEKYPSSVPLSTMPPQVLDSLPKLKGALEYRFIGPRLILLDTEADVILDFTADVLNRGV